MWFCGLLLLSSLANAYDFGAGNIAVPEGFEGPVVKTPSEEFAATGFTRLHDGTQKSTLLQITVFTPANGIPTLDDAKHIAFSKQYLMQFLEGVKRRRENFSTSVIETITISGIPAVRIRWAGQGMDEKVDLYGEMYCLIHNGNLLSFHVQDFSEFDNTQYEAARLAVQSLTLK